ncbi:hypothetical protein ACFC09_17490 [Streptomyces sp. NPDC056161]|uniref:hypothetical protein n=1 Tax=Streptomyces sp. NPDC056161 TaxID=3345732 RepID=UPI0035D531DF
MKVVPYDEEAWVKEHPRGIAFNYLLSGGDPASPENFRFTLGRQDVERFEMPRHRHTFDQIRLPLVGDMNVGEQGRLRAGEIGYFPEGVTYGPQDDPLGDAKLGERLCLVLQFGGASGRGMAIAKRRPGDPAPRPEVQRIKFPRPRYRDIVVADPKSYNWIPLPDQKGVDNKYIASFTERRTWVELVRIAPGATWTSTDPRARRVMAVLSGTGQAEGTGISWMGAVQADAGEELRITAVDELEIFLIGLPPVPAPEVETALFDVVDGHGNVTQFEDVREIQNVIGDRRA